MSRFRLRFLLQEFDLPPGETLIGRSPECQITIEDPLISRHHSKILVSADEATFVDLGSRNGSRLNGKLVSTPTVLVDLDRIRLGAQELVFLHVGDAQRATRSTGAMRLCRSCKTPFPEGPEVCPHCGHPTGIAGEDETISGVEVEPRRVWVLQLLSEVLERAITGNRILEAERILRRAADEMEERVGAGTAEPGQLAQIGGYAVRLAALAREAKWVGWTLGLHRQAMRVPPADLVDLLGKALDVEGVRPSIADFVQFWQDTGIALGEADTVQMERLASFGRAAAGS